MELESDQDAGQAIRQKVIDSLVTTKCLSLGFMSHPKVSTSSITMLVP